MAEADGQEKTEEPTGKRLGEAREGGQVARSQELSSTVAIFGGFSVLFAMGSGLTRQISHAMVGGLSFHSGNLVAQLTDWSHAYLTPLSYTMVTFCLILLAMAIVTNVAQTGFIFSQKSLIPKFERLNPYEGFKRLVSSRGLIQLFKSILKVCVIFVIVYGIVSDRFGEFIYTSVLSISDAQAWAIEMWWTIIRKICLFLAVLSAGDFLYQRYTTHQELMMTHQEVKNEVKDQQLPPHVRAKVRQVQQERAKRVIQKEVPKADVIITNPTHYAIAIKYERFKDSAPRVIAKGKDLLAATIREVAKVNGVPIYEYPVLARSLYKVKVGRHVPADLYEGVAKVLAWVYRVHKKFPNQRRA